MIGFFVGMVSAIITFFTVYVATWHWTTKSWKDSEQKGINPFIPAMFGALVGYVIGFTITGSFLAIAEFSGFPVRYYNCYFFTGDKNYCNTEYRNPQVGVDFLEEYDRRISR